jgi:hypothetical protein
VTAHCHCDNGLSLTTVAKRDQEDKVMPQLASGDVLRYEIRYTQANQRFLNGVYFRYLDSFGVTDDYATYGNQMLAQFFLPAHIIDQLQSTISSTISIDSHRVQKVYPTRLAPVTSVLSIVGAVGSGPAPLNSSMTFTKRSINATRWGIGSWHQPGLNVANMQNSGNWLPTPADDLGGFLTAEFSGMHTPAGGNGSYQGIIWSPAQPTRKTDITSFDPQYTIRTMHRRTVRVGE